MVYRHTIMTTSKFSIKILKRVSSKFQNISRQKPKNVFSECCTETRSKDHAWTKSKAIRSSPTSTGKSSKQCRSSLPVSFAKDAQKAHRPTPHNRKKNWLCCSKITTRLKVVQMTSKGEVPNASSQTKTTAKTTAHTIESRAIHLQESCETRYKMRKL